MRRVKSILCVHQGADLYGSDRSFLQCVQAIRQKYPTSLIDVVVPVDGPLVQELRLTCNNIIFMDVGNLSRSDFKELKIRKFLHIARQVNQCRKIMTKYDVIYLNTLVVFSFMIANIFTKRLTIHHVREVPQSKLENLVFSIYFWISKSYVVFNSHYTKSTFNAIGSTQFDVVYNGVPQVTSNNKINKSRDTFNVLLIGRINEWKGHDVALDALSLLNSENNNIHFRFVGSASSSSVQRESEYKELIMGIDNIDILPFTNNPAAHFDWAHIIIVPSIRPEPFGRVAIEAQSASRVVIASRNGGLQEIIGNNFGGFLFTPGNHEELSELIILLASDPDLYLEKAEEAYHNYQRRFTSEVLKNALFDYFDKVITS